MCGIGFAINYGSGQLDLEQLGEMWTAMSLRGTDASGYYFERGQEKRMVKMPLQSEDALKEINANKSMKDVRLNGKEKMILFHTRASTQGTPSDNNNNMPIFSKHFVLVHNGIIRTPFEPTKYKYRGKVDSEEILAHIERFGWNKALGELSGGMAIAVKPFAGKSIYLYRRSNPLSLVYDSKKNVLYGASLADYAPEISALRLQDALFSPSVHHVIMAPETLYKVSLHRREIVEKGIFINQTKTHVWPETQAQKGWGGNEK